MRKRRVFYGWWILLATSLIHFWGAGIFFYSFTAFFNPLVKEFRWSYAVTSLASSFRSLESGLASPLVGFLTDRFGPRRLVLVGVILAGVGGILMSRVSSLGSFYAFFVFMSLGSSLMQPLPGWTAVANWFSRKRGITMGILMASIGVSGIFIPLVNWIIGEYQWRTAFIIVGVSTWIVGIPLSLVLRHRPEAYGYLPDGEEHSLVDTKTSTEQKEPNLGEEVDGFSVREAMKTQAFWMLAMATLASSASINSVMIHIMPALISVPLSREVASSIAALTVVSSVVGRLGFGWLGDKIDKRYLLASALLLQALGLIIFAYTRSLSYAIAFLVVFGPGFGGVIVLRVSIQAEYFGRKAFGSIQGLSQAILMGGTILGPFFAGWVYDIQGNYQWAWLTLAIMVFTSIPLTLAARVPRRTSAR